MYIDLHLVHEVTSPQAFEGLRLTGRKVRRPDLTVATMDHNVPTTSRSLPIVDQISKKQMETLSENCEEFGVTLYDLHSQRQGIVHVIGPELGLTQPGMTIVCGDSHTSTHGAFGALAFGIGTSEVEHVLATQCLPQSTPKTMEIRVNGQLGAGRHGQRHHSRHHRQDRHGRRDGLCRGIHRRSHPFAFDGRPHDGLQHEHRSGRAGGHDRAGREDVRLHPGQDRSRPQGEEWDEAVAAWRELPTDAGAAYDTLVELDAAEIAPYVSWGTSPGMVVPITGAVPSPDDYADPADRRAAERALEYMGLSAARPDAGDRTGHRLYRLLHQWPHRRPARRGGHLEGPQSPCRPAGAGRSRLRAGQTPGRGRRAWTRSSKTPALTGARPAAPCASGMNPDILQPGERCASTSNRNFEGRQGKGGRTHLVSPQMAAAAAIAGHLVDIREWSKN